MNNYQLNDEVGKGPFSTVYKGRRSKTIEYYAILSIEKCRRERVLNSVQFLRSMHHANIIQFHNWYETCNHLWVITEYCTGGDLRSVLALGETLSERSLRVLGRDVAEGLLYIHSRGILYNDLKPSNLLMDSTATLRYYDFGLSCTLKSAASRWPVGTPLYMAPELFVRGKGAYSVASDLWSLGCLLYELATGQPPFSGKDLEQLLHHILTQPARRIPTASDSFNSLVQHLLVKEPARRATWEEVANSSFWSERLRFPTGGLPAPATPVERRRSVRTPSGWTEAEIHRAIQQAVLWARANQANQASASVDGLVGTDGVDREMDFTPPTEEAARTERAGEILTLSEAIRSDELQRGVTVPRRTTPEKHRESARAGALPPSRGGGGGGKDWSRGGTALPNARVRDVAAVVGNGSGGRPAVDGVRRISEVHIDRTTVERIKVAELMWHPSDANIRPLSMNNRIERYVEASFRADQLTFTPYSLKEVKALQGEELAQYVTNIYRLLASPSASHEEKLNAMAYLESICVDASTANIFVNSSVMTLCARIAGQKKLPGALRAEAATIMGLLVRHTAFIHGDLAKSGIILGVMQVFEDETDVGVRRKLLACIGEFLFYVAVQPQKDRVPWGIDPTAVEEVYMTALESSDDVLQHYAAKSIENLASVQDLSFILSMLAVPRIVASLLDVYNLPAAEHRSDYMRASALGAALKLAIARESLILCILRAPSFPTSSYAGLLRSPAPLGRTVQLLLTFLSHALVKVMVTSRNPYTTVWAATVEPPKEALFASSLTVEEAQDVLTVVSEVMVYIVAHIGEGGERLTAPARGKSMLLLLLIGCLGGITMARLCSGRSIACLARLLRDADPYVQRCATAFSCFLSLFIADKLRSVACHVSSTTTPLYLSVLQQFLNASSVRQRVELRPEVFKSLAECLEKSLLSTLYGAYENDFNALVERIVQCPETLVRYREAICVHLVKPYTEMVQRRGSARHFAAIRILTSMMISMTADRAGNGGDAGPLTRAVETVATALAAVLPTLLAEAEPIPTHTLCLLATCGEWASRCLDPFTQRDAVCQLMDYMHQATETDLHHLLVMLRVMLTEGGHERSEGASPLVVQLISCGLPKDLMTSITWTSKEGVSPSMEISCEVAHLLLKRVAEDPERYGAESFHPFIDRDRVRTLWLPLCGGGGSSTCAEHAAGVLHELVRRLPAARVEFLSEEGTRALQAVLPPSKTDAGDGAVVTLLLKTLLGALEGEEAGELPPLPDRSTLLKALRDTLEGVDQVEMIPRVSHVSSLLTQLHGSPSS